jgi:hypothetical protein
MDSRDEPWPEEIESIKKYMESFYTLFYPIDPFGDLAENWEDWPSMVSHPQVDIHIDIIGRDH